MKQILLLLLFFSTLNASAQHRKKRHPGDTSGMIGWASYYHDRFHGRKTSNGEIYHKNKLTAAHRTLPMGTRVRVINLKTKKWVIVRINDRGPVPKRRIIDLSRRAARHLGMLNGKGILKVKIVILPNIEVPDNSFRKNEAL